MKNFFFKQVFPFKKLNLLASRIKRPKFINSSRFVIASFLLNTYFNFSNFNHNVESSSSFSEKEDSENYSVILNDDFEENEMREIQVNANPSDSIIICKYQGKYYCFQNNCPHFNRPLSKGLLLNDRIICPSHNAAFSIINGLPEQGPSLDALTTYEVQNKDGKIYVTIPKEQLKKSKRIKMTKRNAHDQRVVVIIGTGPAGLSCAETLRQANYQGEIILLGKEKVAPYDRHKLSKGIIEVEVDMLCLRPDSFFKEFDIDLRKDTSVKAIDFDHKYVILEDMSKIYYDNLVLATGSVPCKLNIPGKNLNNVFTLREYKEHKEIKTLLNSNTIKNVLIIGSSFIGMEVSSTIKKEYGSKLSSITVTDITSVPYEKALGESVGKALGLFHERQGVKLLMGKKVVKLEGDENSVKNVIFSDGTILPADLVIMGTGVLPNTALFQSKLEIDQNNGGVKTDVFLRTSEKNVYAIGDIASFPSSIDNKQKRIEHYNVAIEHGSIAAFNILGKFKPVEDISFFWTRVWEKSLQYSGFCTDFEEVHIEGDLKTMDFKAFYLKGNRVVGAAAYAKPNFAQLCYEAMRMNLMFSAEQIKKGEFSDQELIKRIRESENCKQCNRSECCS